MSADTSVVQPLPLGIPGSAFALPSTIHDSIKRQVEAVRATLGPDQTIAFIGVATGRGVNFALAVRVGDHWDIGAWYGTKKSWNAPLSDTEAGAYVHFAR